MFRRGGGTLVLITGGARAGKSSFALAWAESADCRRRLFVATAVACDREMKVRIARHRRQRGRGWRTLEEPLQLPERFPVSFLSSDSLLLLDCLPTFITNHLLAGRSSSQILQRVRRLLRALRRPGLTSVLVTNEVGLGIVPEHPLGRRFRDLLGEVNQEAAKEAEEVHGLISGIPWRIK